MKKGSSYLVLLLEAVALSPFHLGDVLQQVCHSDGGLELSPRVGHLHGLAAAVRVRLDGQRGLRQLPMAAVCGDTGGNTSFQLPASSSSILSLFV